MEIIDNINNVLGFFANFIGVFSAIFAGGAWYQAWKLKRDLLEDTKRKNSYVEVKLRLTGGNTEIQLPVELRREILTRSELLGYLGMLPMKEKGKRYSLEYLSKREFSRKINQLAASKKESELIIPCSKEELAQFDVELTDIS